MYVHGRTPLPPLQKRVLENRRILYGECENGFPHTLCVLSFYLLYDCVRVVAEYPQEVSQRLRHRALRFGQLGVASPATSGDRPEVACSLEAAEV